MLRFAMAGYSGTPLAKKLGIKDGSRVLLARAPAGFEDLLEERPPGAAVSRRAGKLPHDVILAFVERAADVPDLFETHGPRLTTAGGLWICWPKVHLRTDPDLSENPIRAAGLAAGLVDNKVCAVSDDWSGLRFVRRLKDRPATR